VVCYCVVVVYCLGVWNWVTDSGVLVSIWWCIV
jgi:hypothetical protein